MNTAAPMAAAPHPAITHPAAPAMPPSTETGPGPAQFSALRPGPVAAGLGRRVLAGLIDLVLALPVLLLMLVASLLLAVALAPVSAASTAFVFGAESSAAGVAAQAAQAGPGLVDELLVWPLISDAAAETAVLTAVIGTVLVLPLLVEILSRGSSLGKLLLGLQVVSVDGSALSTRQSVLRALIGIGERYLSLGLIALISAAISRRRQRLGDVIANTQVVNTRGELATAALPRIGAELWQWAQRADLSTVNPQQIASARAMLHGRFATQEQLIALANQLHTQIRPAPPASPAWAFLAAVTAQHTLRCHAALGHGKTGGDTGAQLARP